MNAGPSIAVVDYGMGNRRSVQKALEHVGARAEITSQHDWIRRADGVVVPGVGAFPLAMERLNQSGLSELILELAGQDTPILGICLGMQLLFDRSEELGSTAGLGLIAGNVKWLDSAGLRIPHIGWNEVRFERSSPLNEGMRAGGAPFYHVHSLAAHPRDPADVVGSTEYGERFATIVARGSIYGVQFHPEKSSRHGLEMLGNFAAICARRPVRAG
jgi:imidazole glycerol-phosphate synthase subunit HisH